uniref:C2 domain-containing protein n=1 Tax=Salix viminalis TaxID=40686 RepID=A0A6N2NLI8_SALVM
MELSFSATNLRDRDVLSKERWNTFEAFRTEVVLNSLNPTWITKHTITFEFEAVQTLVFCAYDIDTQFHNIDVKMLTRSFLGEASCVLSEAK